MKSCVLLAVVTTSAWHASSLIMVTLCDLLIHILRSKNFKLSRVYEGACIYFFLNAKIETKEVEQIV